VPGTGCIRKIPAWLEKTPGGLGDERQLDQRISDAEGRLALLARARRASGEKHRNSAGLRNTYAEAGALGGGTGNAGVF
jgi:hypothetical protein